MRISELKQKEVINAKDCKRLGFVGDVDFDMKNGCMVAIIVPSSVSGLPVQPAALIVGVSRYVA